MKSIRKFKYDKNNKLYASPFVISFNPKSYKTKENDLRRLLTLEKKKGNNDELILWKNIQATLGGTLYLPWINILKDTPNFFYYNDNKNNIHGFILNNNDYESNIVIYNLNAADIDYMKTILIRFYFNENNIKCTKANLILIDCYLEK